MKKIIVNNKKLLKQINCLLKDIPKVKKGTALKSIREDRDKN